jgi:putative ABC transport system ATP-binding protein
VIELGGIGRRFTVGDEVVHALDNVSLTVEAGQYLSIMGPSGSGKSTLLNILGLLDRPDQGVYRLNGVDTTALSDQAQARVRRHQIGFVFQFFHLVPRLTAAENVELPLVLAGVAPAERKARVKEALAVLGLADRSGHRPDQLSGGQRQRVAIARAAVMRPRVILADEPTGNLDRHAGRDVIQIIEALNRQGITVVLVTHDPELGARSGRRITMKDGRIEKDERGETGNG